MRHLAGEVSSVQWRFFGRFSALPGKSPHFAAARCVRVVTGLKNIEIRHATLALVGRSVGRSSTSLIFMALKFKYKSKDEIPAEVAAFYTERDGAWVLDVDGAAEKLRLEEEQKLKAGEFERFWMRA
jgi:hypothetical protein